MGFEFEYKVWTDSRADKSTTGDRIISTVNVTAIEMRPLDLSRFTYRTTAVFTNGPVQDGRQLQFN